MSAERLRPLAGVTARGMVMLFLVVTFALTWLMFLPVIVGLADPESPAGLIFLPLIGVGAPTIRAFVLTGLSEGRGESESCGGVGGVGESPARSP